jgi:hypothetical protein
LPLMVGNIDDAISDSSACIDYYCNHNDHNIIASLELPIQRALAKSKVIPSSVQAQLDAHIKKYIDLYEAKYCTCGSGKRSCGYEYEKRSFRYGDLNDDGKKDIAVVYSIAGLCCTNGFWYYLAVFINNGSNYEFVTSEEVGGKLNRFIELDSIKHGRIILDTLNYLDSDAACCPSKKDRVTYYLQDGKLIEDYLFSK